MLSQHEDMYKTLLELSFEISEVIINTTDRVMMYKKILDRLCDKLVLTMRKYGKCPRTTAL